ncbi:ABC-2 type transport system permease protein [Paenarthrobacter nicotinovorans]|uniref:ABC-2 type transport system permease protein n=1 Tax=Paenarthrobacter nicotinovorans TaxID=29320 RepID=A0ABT9TT97_PAENI|nr:ABC transporter permease [Paenarthrobacter nicotinovorans]MBP2394980.1 ABC-2 type transport system permease protein [Paenarthrobacter nicotinovorans]MDQ0104911.1 ABC-2 type transport system permease protein [Paenarthrobacter nicotinovorans]UKE98861.1 ABC transporter permease [Paenarthrobacter nicotinovorans]UKF03650.1 ABC transporter permease [Paenarthrobacter nicotinovorans]GAT89870.1 elastin-like protein [Paenarthrobacter nicotinovorans]
MSKPFEGLTAAVVVEARKMRLSRTVLGAGSILILGVNALASGFALAARSGNQAALAKLGPLASQGGWTGYLASAQQITAAGSVLAFGIVLAWMYGREFTDGTISGLFALPVRRPTVALAKLIVFAGWSFAVAVLLTATLVALGLILGFGWPNSTELAGLGRIHPLIVLSALVATPAAWSATLGRGVLSGIGLTVGVMAGTQVAVLVGAGPWFPIAAPALWAIAPDTVPPAALALTLGIPLTFGALTLWAWSRLQLDR